MYEPDVGFFASGHGAGRAGADFVTSPEVGSLFGACVARALDRCWHELGAPDPFVVVEAGAGNGRLARDVLRAAPACATALHYVLVETSAARRDEQRRLLDLEPPDEALGPFTPPSADDVAQPVSGTGPVVTALDDLPALELTGVVVANELFDNLVFGIAERTQHGWSEVRVAKAAAGGFGEVLVPAEREDALALDAVTEGLVVAAGARLPLPRGIDAWLASCSRMLQHGFVIAIDYVDGARGVLERGPHDWLRTYRGHVRGGSPLAEPGAFDITADVVREQLLHASRRVGMRFVSEQSQAEWLGELGIGALAEAGRRTWEARAHIGDLEALAGRSRVSEADALTDPAGLGAHRVFTFAR